MGIVLYAAIFLSVPVIAYSIVLVKIAILTEKARKEQQNWPVPDALPSVSVIIPFRNEEKNLPALLKGLSELQYRKELLEIILTDDHSEDEGFLCAEKYIKEYDIQNVTLKKLPQGEKGKKAAIELGVSLAKHDFLLFTDADCRMSAFWVNDLVLVQHHENAAMVCGPVTVLTQSFPQKLEMLETAALMATSAAGILLNKPNFCNGANLLINKAVYLQAAKKRKDAFMASGDDVFLLHQLHKEEEKIAYCLMEHSGVETDAHQSLRELVNQKVRWAGKWKSGLRGANYGLALLIWFFHALFLFTLVFLGIHQPVWAFCLYAGKNFAETLFLKNFCHTHDYQHNSAKVFLFQIPYSLYVLFMGIRILLSSSFSWKGREFVG
jgi:cellulose synthase/poly-beta-1,6-N-acetylglucosamine synthase-like glycosyltransferase